MTVREIKLKAIEAALEVCLPGADPENRARLLEWAVAARRAA